MIGKLMQNYRLSTAIFFASLFAFLLSPAVMAKDKWIHLQTQNFNVIGNVEEKKMRELALKLEQFRFTFSQIYPGTPSAEPVPVTVIFFKDDNSFNPFKPVYKGKRRNDVEGFFQS